MENSPSLIERVLPTARVVLFWLGVIVWLLGFGLGLIFRFDNTSVWFFLAGMGFMHASDLGRPVIINMFNTLEEQPVRNVMNSGYL